MIYHHGTRAAATQHNLDIIDFIVNNMCKQHAVTAQLPHALVHDDTVRPCAEKSVDHKEGSLGFLVNNLVKNWEKEASYKLKGSKIMPHTFADLLKCTFQARSLWRAGVYLRHRLHAVHHA